MTTGADAQPLERELDRPDVAVGEVDDRELHSTPLVLGMHRGAFASDRLAQRAPECLEARLGLVVVVLAARRGRGSRRRMLSASERKMCAVISVG